MTREEAVEKINWLYYEADYGNNLPDDIETAVDMAIEALEQPEIIRCKNCTYCEDVGPGLFYCKSEDIVPVGQYVEAGFYCGFARRRDKANNI